MGLNSRSLTVGTLVLQGSEAQLMWFALTVLIEILFTGFASQSHVLLLSAAGYWVGSLWCQLRVICNVSLCGTTGTSSCCWKMWAYYHLLPYNLILKHDIFNLATYRLQNTGFKIMCSNTDEINMVATVQGEQGVWMFIFPDIFPDRENAGNLPKNIKSNTRKILNF